MIPAPVTRAWRISLDSFYHFRRWLSVLITYLSLHLFGSEIGWGAIKNGKIDSASGGRLDLDKAQDLDLLLSEAKAQLAEADGRRASTTDKCKSLVTLSSVVLAASGLVVSRASLDSGWSQVLLLLAALSLLHVVVLISMHFAVGKDMLPVIKQEDVPLSGEDLRKSLINSYRLCLTDRNSRADFLVEVYKGARFFFLLGLTILIALLIVAFPAIGKEDLPAKVAEKLTEDSRFIGVLRERIKELDERSKPQQPAPLPGPTSLAPDSKVGSPAPPQSSTSGPQGGSTCNPSGNPPAPAGVPGDPPDKQQGGPQRPQGSADPNTKP